MGEEDEVKQGAGSKIANTAKEKGKEAVKNQGKKAAKKVASKFSKKFAQKAASASMKGPMMMLMLKVLVVILIIMAIIGIIMFVVTMPGMVMEKLKALFKSIGNAIASFFGRDSAELQADEEKINETLTYLEQMGYDLKGEGFITASYTNDDVPKDKVGEWVGDKEHENTGVIRSKEDDSIVMAHSEFIFNYLISDNYVYTVKNFNIVTGDSFWSALGALFIQIGSVFGYNAGEDWGEGMIALYDEGSSVGKKGELYESDLLSWENIDVDAEARTMTIRRGWFQNKMVYSLDGWTGRYGMPLEFLLSIHLATKMPDLPYDMVQAFGGQGSDLGTEVNIVLHKLEGVSAITGYKKDFPTEGTAETDYITYGEMEEIKGEGWIFTDGWTLSKKEAAKVMKLGVKSPDGCTYKDPTFEIIYASDNGNKGIFDSDKQAELERYGMKDSEFEDLNAELGKTVAIRTGEKFNVKEAMIEVNDKDSRGTGKAWQEATDLGYEYETVKKQGGYYEPTEPEKFNGKGFVEGECGCSGDKCEETCKKMADINESNQEEYGWCNKHRYRVSSHGVSSWFNYYCKANTFSQIEKYVYEREWQADYDEDGDGTVDKEDVTFRWVSYVYKVYKYSDEARTKNKRYEKSYIFDYVMRDLTFDELVEKGILNKDGTAVKEQRCSNDKNLEECCSTCKNHVKKIMKLMKDGNDPEFDTYTPYIADVTNHWYRDVYFATSGNQNFVQVDQEYEALMGERWTLYETDDNGQYVLYELNDNGTISNRVFNGTQQDANEKGVPVVKKAETIKITDTDANGDQLIDWVKNGSVWSAYKVNDEEVSTGWEPLYEKSEKAEEDKTTEEILKERMFVNITTKNDITQVEEGQRTATNPKIRNMFLNNIYFRYDGSPETADVIEALRKKISESDLKFGHLSESDLKATVELDTDGDGKKEKYTAKDYTGKVELTQDSLSAFSMLENTHTLDADFIYKDFKELVVELGYFTKEELSDETPRIFAWMIPEIGSGGFPIASLDKKENEYGTQAHSRMDYQANAKNTLAAVYQKAAEEIANGERDENIESGAIGVPSDSNLPGNISSLNSNTNSTSEVGILQAFRSNANIAEIVGAMGFKFERIPESGDGYEYKVRTGNVEYTHYYQFTGSYAEKTFTWSGSTKTLHAAACGPTSCINLLTGYGHDVNPTNDIVGINFDATIDGIKAFMESYDVTGESYYGLSDTEFISKIEEAFSEGRPIITLMHQSKTGDSFWTSGGHFVPMIGQDENGNIITLDSGSSNAARHTYDGGVEGLMSCLVAVWIADEAPDGSMRSSGQPYEGFEGGEAVVSPVTGILLEYGTYEKGKIDPVTEKESRVNVDFKYANNSSEETENADGSENNSGNSGNEESIQDVVDYVGYAKIMILDDETYLELENQMKGSAPKAIAGMKDREGNAIQSLVDKDGNYLENSALKSPDILTSEDANVKWSDDEITLYGYKEFAEMYSEFGVAGNIIYIDGFKCELPAAGGEETEESADDEEAKEKDLTGEAIPNKEYFKQKASDQEYDKVLYEKEERFNLSSLDATNKLNNENDIKAQADPIVMVGDKILIKEGTIIGRTMSNQEVIEAREANGIVTPTTTEETGNDSGNEAGDGSDDGTGDAEENKDPVIGNYLRIIMRDEDDTVVENVEEYMKLDEEGGGSNGLIDGDTFVIPEEVMQIQMPPTYEAINRQELGMSQWSNGTTQRALYELWVEQGRVAYNGQSKGGTVSSGIAVIEIDGKEYVPIALKPSFGSPGDYVQIVFEDGEILDCIIFDTKATDSGSYFAEGDHGRIDYGHTSGGQVSVLEAVIKGRPSGNTYTPEPLYDVDWFQKKTAQITNAGAIFP